ncbi:cholecystokinin receptor type A-like [Ornithodoros turicata]|uniref:cholecystokinin receptor type A-like n=1 Tax=Ornithodoros turicata TaxID=34597 RepID=UPI00313961FD
MINKAAMFEIAVTSSHGDCGQQPANSSASNVLDCSFRPFQSTRNFTFNNQTDLPSGFVFFEHPEDMLVPWVNNPHFPYIVVTYLITFLVGVSGNAAVVSVMAGDRASRNVTSVFLVSLAVSDLLLLLVCAPLDVAHYFVITWDSGVTICKMAAYVETISAFASVLNMVAVTLERFVVIVFPIHSRSVCTMSNCKRLMVCVWVVSFVVAIPIIFVKETMTATFTNYVLNVTTFTCREANDWRGQSVAWYRLVLLFALPLIIMVVCYSWVIVELWISTKTMDQLTHSAKFSYQCHPGPGGESRVRVSLQPQSHPNCRLILRGHANSSDIRDVKKARQQVIKMLILVVLLFLLCWGPRLIMEIAFKCCLTIFDNGVYTVRFLFYLMPFVHSCLNPIVYCFMSTKFRKRMLRCIERSCPVLCYRARGVRPGTSRVPAAHSRSSSRNGTTRLGSTYTFTSCATSNVVVDDLSL